MATTAQEAIWYGDTIVGDPITSFTNRFTGVNAMGAGAAVNTPALTDPDLDFSTKKSATFAEASVQYINVDAADNAAWMHQDCCVGGAIKPDKDADVTQTLFSTFGEGGGFVGIMARYDSTNDRIVYRVGDGTGTLLVDTATPNGSVVQGLVHTYVLAVWDDSTDTHFEAYVDGLITLKGKKIGRTTAAGSPQGLLRICSRSPSATWYFNGKIGPFIALRDHTQARRVAEWLHRGNR
jgi:hypothetical protein